MTTYHEVSKKRTDWNGEGLPPVGATVLMRYMYDSKIVCHIVTVKYASATYCIGEFHGGSEHCFRIGEYQYEMAETPQQRQERIEAAIRLHDIANLAYYEGCLPLNCSWSDAGERVKNMWLAVVDETKYRKEAK